MFTCDCRSMEANSVLEALRLSVASNTIESFQKGHKWNFAEVIRKTSKNHIYKLYLCDS